MNTKMLKDFLPKKFFFRLFIKTFILLCPLLGMAGDLNSAKSLLNTGNHAYGDGRYEAALGYYMQAIKTGNISPDLYYNLAQTHWKLQQKGPALFCFKKALTLHPYWKQASENVRHLYREMDLPAEKSLSVLKKIPLNGWTYALVISFWIAAFFVIKIIFSALGRWLFIILSVIGLSIAVIVGAILWICSEDLKTVIILESTPLKFSPTEKSPQRQTLKEGTICKYVDQKDNYLFIEAFSGNQKSEGWVRKDDAGILY